MSMRQTERFDDPLEAVRAALDGFQRRVWTALPGIVTAYDATDNTVSVQPALKVNVMNAAGVVQATTLPLLVKCPVVFPGGGGYTLTFPIAAGDEVLVVFASRCIDAWWQSGGVQAQIELRAHDLSDGFAVPEPFSVPRVPGGISLTTTQLRSVDGTVYVEVDHATGRVHLKAPTEILLDAPTTIVTGVLQVQNTAALSVASSVAGVMQVTGEIIAGYGGANISITTHYHTDPQGGDTGAPVAGS